MSSPGTTIPDAQQPTITNDAFISYPRKDEQFAAALEKVLQAYKPPKDLKLPQRYLAIFRDKDDFTGVEYHQSLEQHLKGSGKMIVICCPDACKSTYVNDEIERFVHLHGAENIIAVHLAGITNKDAKPEEGGKSCPGESSSVIRSRTERPRRKSRTLSRFVVQIILRYSFLKE